MLKHVWVVISAACLVFCGCAGKSDKTSKSQSGDKTNAGAMKTSKAASSDKPVPEMSAVESKPISATSEDGSTVELYQETWSDTQKFMASQQGKIVVIDFWATY